MMPTPKIDLLAKWKFVLAINRHTELHDLDRRVAVELTEKYNKDKGYCWIGQDTLASTLGRQRRAIRRSLDKLIELELFYVERRGKGLSNHHCPNWNVGTQACQVDNSGLGTQVTAGGHTEVPTVGTPTCPNTSYTPLASSLGGIEEVSPTNAEAVAYAPASASGGVPEGFYEFWQAYPRKEGRKSAIKAFIKAVAGGVGVGLLQAKASQYAIAKSDIDQKWMKMPAAWLNDECWLEDPQPPKTNNQSNRSKSKPSSSVNSTLAPDGVLFQYKECVMHNELGGGRIEAFWGEDVEVRFHEGIQRVALSSVRKLKVEEEVLHKKYGWGFITEILGDQLQVEFETDEKVRLVPLMTIDYAAK